MSDTTGDAGEKPDETSAPGAETKPAEAPKPAKAATKKATPAAPKPDAKATTKKATAAKDATPPAPEAPKAAEKEPAPAAPDSPAVEEPAAPAGGTDADSDPGAGGSDPAPSDSDPAAEGGDPGAGGGDSTPNDNQTPPGDDSDLEAVEDIAPEPGWVDIAATPITGAVIQYQRRSERTEDGKVHLRHRTVTGYCVWDEVPWEEVLVDPDEPGDFAHLSAMLR